MLDEYRKSKIVKSLKITANLCSYTLQNKYCFVIQCLLLSY